MHKNTVTADTVLLRNQSIFASSVDNELVMMDETQGLYFGLNPVGKTIWELLETPLSYQNLIERLAETYNVSRETCEIDVEKFINHLIDHKLVQLSPQ